MSNKVERPDIYPELALPPFLSRQPEGLLLVKRSFAREGGVGPYNWVFDFGHSRDSLREAVPPEQRITKNSGGDLFFLGFEDPRIKGRMLEITRLANDPQRSFENEADKEEYRLHLGLVYQRLARKVSDRIGSEQALTFSPKNGGIYVKEVFRNTGFSREAFFDYRMSRILGADGRLMVGMKLGENNPPIADFRTFVFADDCLASDISAWGTLEMIKNELVKNCISPSEAKVIVAVSAGTQKGLQSLLSAETRRHFGFGKMGVVVGVPVYQMTENFYLQHPDGSFVVGDMGKWTKR